MPREVQATMVQSESAAGKVSLPLVLVAYCYAPGPARTIYIETSVSERALSNLLFPITEHQNQSSTTFLSYKIVIMSKSLTDC
jgi:hypothetical protein